jgi:hypothetical protein
MPLWLSLLTVTLMTAAPALATPKASSELKDQEGQWHRAANAFDGLLSTGWAEGVPGSGEGSWIELPFDRPVDVTSVSVWPGNLSQGRRSVAEYGRPRTITVTLTATDGSEVTREERLPDGRQDRAGPQRIDIPIVAKARKLRVTVNDVYEGGVFNDTFIAEIGVNFVDGANPAVVQRLQEWVDSAPGQKAKQKNYDEIVALLERIEAAEFGDRDALRELMDRAGDGPPFLRAQLNRVPAGFRVQALPPDEIALRALQKTRDANAIPAFEMATLRSSGAEQKKLELQTEYFYALQELIGGGNRNIPVWGQPGWEPGALRSFGEPMNLEVDRWGDIYVADLGNHRVQRFSPEGRHNKTWGGKAGIGNAWFAGTRRYHVAGSEPGDKPGQFTNPVDIALIPGKDGEGFVTLDGTGVVQIFSEDGRPVRSWKVRSRYDIRPNVGQEGYVAFAGNRILVVWRNEVFVYNTDSEELNNFKLEDGAPNGMEVLRNGKLLMIFADQLVMYSADGFRHGGVMSVNDLGPGIEDWDITIDEKGKLWVVTDTGIIAKYKKPGKVDFTVKFSKIDLIRPRLAVFDGMVYVTDRDRILKVDALELKKKLELEAKEAGP